MNGDAEQSDCETFQVAAAAFAAIGSEFRVQLLHALYEADRPIGFAELADAVDERDSGRLNYHLDKLTGLFVTKGPSGYRLTLQGKRIVSAILASRYVDETASYAVPLERPCPDCGTDSLRIEQEGHQPEIRCTRCERVLGRFSPFPTTGWEGREPEDVRAAIQSQALRYMELALDDVCFDCFSSLARERHVYEDGPRASTLFDDGFPYTPIFDCTTCTNYLVITYSNIAWLHPTVRSFLRSRGVSPIQTPIWSKAHVLDDLSVELRSEEPWRVEVSFRLGSDRCRTVVDDRHEVEQVTRETVFRE